VIAEWMTMKELTQDEIQNVAGGLVPALIGAAVTIALATVAAGAYLGANMAERDNAQTK